MKEWSILIKVQADTKEDACDAAATFLNNGGEPDSILQGGCRLVYNSVSTCINEADITAFWDSINKDNKTYPEAMQVLVNRFLSSK